MSTEFSLQIIHVEGVQWEHHFHSIVPNLYAQLKFGDAIQKTQAIKDKSPTWNETFTLPSSDASALLTIEVKHKSSLKGRKSACVGSIGIQLDELFSKCANGEAQLSLHPPPGKAYRGPIIFVRLLDTVKTMTDVKCDVLAADQAVQLSGIVSSASGAKFDAVEELATELDNQSELYKCLVSLCKKFGLFADIIDALSEVHPYLHAAWQVTSSLFKVVSKQFENDKSVVDLVCIMKETFDFVCEIDDLPNKVRSLKQSIIKLLKQTIEFCLFVRDFFSHRFFGRVLDSINSTRKIDEIKKSFDSLKEELSSRVALHTAFVSVRISQNVDTLVLKQRLRPMEKNASDRPRCLVGTRDEYLNQAMDWVFSDTSKNIMWLHGVPGSGKSTIAATVADYCDDMSRLATFLFFEQGKAEYSSIIQTIAFRLASFDSSIAPHVIAALDQNKNIEDSSPTRQFQKLILEPLDAAKAEVQGPILVILDALDECGTIGTRSNVIQLLKDEFGKLPSKFRFLVTSRPEGDIVKALSSESHVLEIELDHSSKDSRHDVRVYIDRAMRDAVIEPIPEGWTWDDKLNVLGDSADGLFIWASTAVRLVQLATFQLDYVEKLVSNAKSLSLQELYATALRDALSWDDTTRSIFQNVVSLILFGKTQLTDKVIDGMLHLVPPKGSAAILSKLQALIAYKPGEPIRIHHASFGDYLTSSVCSNPCVVHPGSSKPSQCIGGPWLIDVPIQKHLLVTRCFGVMEDMLRFNICDLETSFLLNDDVIGLKERVKDKIPPHLEYACLYWAQHLRDVPYYPDLLDAMSSFVKRRLLYWFEILSLLKKLGRVASPALLNAVKWTETYNTDITSFLRGASALATEFAAPITQSTPHIYVSMLPLTKEDSVVSAHYSKQVFSSLQVDRIGTKMAPLWLKVLEGHTDAVWSVAFSPDGRRIVSGSADRTIMIWDAESGEAVSQPFEGHEHGVSSVAFSLDGTRIVSGSWDNTIRVWDTENGEVVSGPFEGHSDAIESVAFSPDGTRIASCSTDETVRVWCAETGQVVSEPFEGHTNVINSVAFSPDGKHIVSGSGDKTIRVWDAETGQTVLGPFIGHTDNVSSVAFSPSGTRVVSGSWDKSIRIWDLESGDVVCDPFEGHTDRVYCVAFSPDGSRIASGSRDDTIMIWDVESGEVVSGPFEGHTNIILSVAFSPDGKRIISSSHDKTVRIWDAGIGKVVIGSSEGHKDTAYSVAFSPDGRHIVSGSGDKTIRIWDVKSGKTVGNPFEGHTDHIRSVAFSPDGKRIVSGSNDKTIRVWDADSGEAVSGPFEGHTGTVNSVAFSPDGARIVSGSSDNTVIVRNAESGEVIAGPFDGHTDTIHSVAFSPDGTRVASGSEDDTIIVWNAESGEVVAGPFNGHTNTIRSVTFSPDGMCIASGSNDNTIIIWNAENGEVVSGPFRRHTYLVYCVAFSPNGECIVSGSLDKTIIIWNAENGQIVAGPFEGHTAGVHSVAFSLDGMHIVSGSSDKTIRVWDVARGEIISRLFGEYTDPSLSVVLSANNEDFANWILNENGWILGPHSELLLWVPPDIRPTLWLPQNTAILSCAFSTKLDFSNVVHGGRWQGCVMPFE